MNHALAFSGHSSEDNPRGTITPLEFERYREAIRTIQDAQRKIGDELWRINEMLAKASPGNPNCKNLRHSGDCDRQ